MAVQVEGVVEEVAPLEDGAPVGQQLRDVQVVEEKMFRQDNGSFRYYVCMQLPKAALEAAIEDAIAKDAKLNLEFDRAQFKKIFEEQMAAFSQQ